MVLDGGFTAGVSVGEGTKELNELIGDMVYKSKIYHARDVRYDELRSTDDLFSLQILQFELAQ